MKPWRIWLVAGFSLCGVARAAPSFDDALKQAAVEYRHHAEDAATQLNQTRTRIADEKAPLLRQLRAAEDRIVAAESETTRYDAIREEGADTQRKALQELDTIRKTTSYVSTLAHDSLKAASDSLAPGEDQSVGDRMEALQKQLDRAPGGQAAMDTAEFLLAQTEQSLGGYRAKGRAMLADTSQVVEGTFAFAGPETYFLPASGGPAGTVRPRESARQPISFALPQWRTESAFAFFAGAESTVMADASGGKAIRLNETRGTLLQHIEKGGLVAFAIVIVGVCAALMILQKVRDLRRMAVDSPAAVGVVLNLVAGGSMEEAEAAVAALKRSTRELFEVGLRNVGEPKIILEQRLQAVLLEQRLDYERRLPLLAVIATASPLMGLLGTVVGMVRTFALITVFGTGNAGKLSSGISEVLIATELGLTVAIPTLVAHGFIAQRVHKNLSLLERYALQFTTAVDAAKAAALEPRNAAMEK